jgi:hypothetical protein
MVTSAVNRPSTQASGRTIPYGAPPLMFALWSQSGASGRTNDPAPGVCALQSRQAVNVSSKYSVSTHLGSSIPPPQSPAGLPTPTPAIADVFRPARRPPPCEPTTAGSWVPGRSVPSANPPAAPNPARWVIGRHRGLVVVVGVKPIPLLGEPLDDELDVAPGTARHLVADQLRVLGQPSLMNGAAKLSQLLPHLVVMTSRVAAKPVRQRSHTPSSCRIDNHQAPCSSARAANSSTGDEIGLPLVPLTHCQRFQGNPGPLLPSGYGVPAGMRSRVRMARAGPRTLWLYDA